VPGQIGFGSVYYHARAKRTKIDKMVSIFFSKFA
jgi:hypothetical protein